MSAKKVVHILAALCALLFGHYTFSVGADPVVYFPPFELRAVPGDRTPFMPMESKNIMGFGSGSFEKQPDIRPQAVRPAVHKVPDNVASASSSVDPSIEIMPSEKHNNNGSSSVHDLLDALGLGAHVEPDTHSRAAQQARDYDYPYPPYPPYQHHSDYGNGGYSHQPEHGYWPQQSYHGRDPYSYPPPMYAHHPPPYEPQPPTKPVLAKVEPLLPVVDKSKLIGKLGGVLGIIQKLLSDAGPVLGTTGTGLINTLINGVVKPLLAAKKGLKTLIGKLLVPLLAVLLMNVEMLVVVWWLWEDCAPAPTYNPYKSPSHSPSTSYGYGGYSYR